MTSTNIARTDDGTIQINFSIPKADIDKAQEKAVEELSKDITVKGFRKGKAPVDKAKERIDPGMLLEKTLGQILPAAYTKAIDENKIKPIIYPKFEIMKQGDIWEIQAKVAELPIVDLPDYNDMVAGAIRAASLKKELSKQEKEDVVIKTLIDSIKVKVPKIIIDEEVNARLSQLLERTEKLGLKLEQYLASIGKTEQSLREEYEKQVVDGISLELILNKMAEVEKIEAPESEVETAIKSAGVTETHQGHVDEQKQIVRSVLKRRIVLDRLASLS
ncbi:MAG TPA: trigger factor [Patescibacteria group bacterium]|nr:trigger factor [Patescibacteria group bacterium]